MPFQVRDTSERYKLPVFPGVPNVYFADQLGTEDTNIPNPIVALGFAWSRGLNPHLQHTSMTSLVL
ncbi:hypothetical protein BDV10DRAFT_183965 [Aspergillus recurvatus]